MTEGMNESPEWTLKKDKAGGMTAWIKLSVSNDEKSNTGCRLAQSLYEI